MKVHSTPAPSLGLLLGSLLAGPWLSGCALFDPTAALQVELPEPPAHWRAAFGDLPWRLLYPGPDGRVWTVDLPAGACAVALPLPKGACAPVLATPLLAGGEGLPPAGGVALPDTPGEDRLALSWTRGAAAHVLLRLVRQGGRLEALNVERFCRELEARAGSDPWSLDLDAIGVELAAGTFRVAAIRAALARDVELPVGDGSWFPESPFTGPVAAAGGLLRLPALPPGFHRLFEVEGRRRIDLFVEEGELLWVEWPPGGP